MPRISFFYGITIAMFWDESGHQTHTSTPRTRDVTHHSRLTGQSLPDRFRHEPLSSSDDGHRFIRRSSWLTGGAPVERNVYTPSTRWRKIRLMTNVGYLPAVTAVEVIGEHELRLTFDDGTVGDVSFSDRQWTGVFEPLRDPARFAKVQIDPLFATIVWPEDGLDMAPEPLYADAKRRPLSRQR
jgi:hypothetical protein